MLLRRKLFVITETELKLIAAAAIIGDSKIQKNVPTFQLLTARVEMKEIC